MEEKLPHHKEEVEVIQASNFDPSCAPPGELVAAKWLQNPAQGRDLLGGLDMSLLGWEYLGSPKEELDVAGKTDFWAAVLCHCDQPKMSGRTAGQIDGVCTYCNYIFQYLYIKFTHVCIFAYVNDAN